MTSQLNVDTIVDKAGSGGTNVKIGNTSVAVAEGGSGTTNTVQGLAKAWIALFGSTMAINDSFNIASVTDNGTGDYSPAINNDMVNSNYTHIGTASNHSGSDNALRNYSKQTNRTQTAGVYNFNTAYVNGTNIDTSVDSVVHGDLA